MKRLAPLLILIAALGLAAFLIYLRPAPREVTPIRPITQIEVLTLQPEAVQLRVSSQGSLMPTRESELAAEVSGRIIEISPRFRAGERIEKGAILFRIDPADYEAAVAAREADVATARLALAQEEALAEQARADWSALGEGEPSDLTLRKPQLTQAIALLASAEAALKKARRDLERTVVRAPYEGLVLSKTVDLGQYVLANPANPVARIYATDTAELRLPLSQAEAQFLQDPRQDHGTVTLYAKGPEGDRKWPARFVRFEATIDPASRLIHAIAEVDEPFEKGLIRGMFLDAVIDGRRLDEAYVLPRYALRGNSHIYVVTPENTLVTRLVEVLQTDDAQAILTSGVEPGERVATSPIPFFVENMPIHIINADEASRHPQ